MTITLLYNPACSKSREARARLEATNADVTYVDYLATPLAHDALVALIAALDAPPIAIVRTKDLAPDAVLTAEASAEDVARALVRYPSAMERPILRVGARAIIARPPSRVHELVPG